MSHLHIPDGVLPGWLVMAGWILTALILGFSIYRTRKTELKRKVPLIGIISALMIVCMTIPIVPIAYHINLSIIAGIILGPAVAFISIFIVDLIIAMFGHGGITVVGLNTVVVGAEAFIGFYLFQLFLAIIGRDSIMWSSGLAAVIALIISTSILVGVVYLSRIDPEIVIGIEGGHPTEVANEANIPSQLTEGINIKSFAKTILILLGIGWFLEGIITAFVIKYVSRVRPDLILPQRA
ncbi:MAG: energy-coupling factor ABC transporter permease [Thermodesulfobacteriota bacterium]